VAVGREDHIDTSADLYQFYLPRLVLNWDADAGSSVHRRIDGTMVFVDISGFTAMSERLARFGKVGAEEVTEVLGGCFEGLLAVAYPLGGRLIKFGGDALLLLFDGDRHEGRAINAAVGMQQAMRSLGRVKTSAGNMTLRMSIGAHSGAFHFFLVGDSHLERLPAPKRLARRLAGRLRRRPVSPARPRPPSAQMAVCPERPRPHRQRLSRRR